MAENAGVPGLDALAKHLGYTFIKNDADADASSKASDAGTDTPKSETPKKDEKEDDKKPKVPAGSQTSFANIYYNNDDDTWTAKEPEDTKPAEGEETAGHAIVLRLQKSKDSRKKYEIHSIVVQSPALKVVLGEILKDYPGVCCNLDRLVFKAPFEPFVHRWGTLLEFIEKDDLDDTTKSHLSLLHEVLKKELGSTIQAFEDYVKNGIVTYEHAWIVFQPGSVIVTTSGAEQVIALRMKSGYYQDTDNGNVYQLWCKRVDWNGKSFGWADEYVQIRQFQGVKEITDLDAFPLAFHSRKESVKASLISRGKRFAELAGCHYRGYDGPAIQRTRNGNILIQNKGRIIIDAESFCNQPDQCMIYIQALSTGTTSDNTAYDDSFFSDQPVETDTQVKTDKKSPAEIFKLTDYQYMLCSSILRGYSLKAKKWLSFYVNHVQPIEWNDQAFNSLVLPQAQKKLILALSKTQAATTNAFDDIVAGKGKGMILLLSGPPGVGKTLTAEAVSENMRVPLYMMSAGDLGLHPEEVESNLETILTMVAKWKAILLIDECDVFLEARSIHDLERNKLVSIFLRLLEYYQGTLFLTTNRVENIDPAFQSRIHIHLKYPDLTPKSRRAIWDTFLSAVPSEFSEKDIHELGELKLNGRQIKNLVKTACLVALEEGRVLRKEHVELVVGVEQSAFGSAEED